MSHIITKPAYQSAEHDPLGCIGCESRTLGICGALQGEQLLELSRMSHKKCVESGSRIGRVVSSEDTFGVILSGVVSLSKNLPDGRHQIVALQFAPSFVGRPFRPLDDIEVSASGQVRICTFPRRSFETMLSNNGDLEHRLLAETLTKLDDTRDWLMALGSKTALERVATYLEMIAVHTAKSSHADRDIPMPLSRGEMADFLGLTIETVSRKMTELRKMKIITFATAASIRIDSEPDLHRVSGS